MFYYLVFIIFTKVFSFQFVENDVHINYELTSLKSCPVISSSFKIFTVNNFSLSDCVASCVFRATCKGLNYKKKFSLCELYSADTIQEFAGDCVFINRSDIISNPIIVNIQNCENDVTCEDEECPHVDIVGGNVLGNMNSFGSIRMFECNDGYSLHGSDLFECKGNKTWVPYPICWKDCSSPILHNSEIETTSNGQQPANATVRCHDGYASTRTSDISNPITEEVITCDKSGVWIPNIDCTLVISDKNKAWNKPAQQSTTYNNYGANRATDGIWISEFFLYGCTHTKWDVEDTAWWEVDLQQVYSVSRIEIRNRKNAYFSKRLYNVTVTVGTSPAPTEFCAFYLDDNPPIERIELQCNTAILGQYVRLTKPNTRYNGDNLSLCEVGVYEA